jgi:hypothetical protein
MPEKELIIGSFSLKMLRPAKKELDKMDKDKAQKICQLLRPKDRSL